MLEHSGKSILFGTTHSGIIFLGRSPYFPTIRDHFKDPTTNNLLMNLIERGEPIHASRPKLAELLSFEFNRAFQRAVSFLEEEGFLRCFKSPKDGRSFVWELDLAKLTEFTGVPFAPAHLADVLLQKARTLPVTEALDKEAPSSAEHLFSADTSNDLGGTANANKEKKGNEGERTRARGPESNEESPGTFPYQYREKFPHWFNQFVRRVNAARRDHFLNHAFGWIGKFLYLGKEFFESLFKKISNKDEVDYPSHYLKECIEERIRNNGESSNEAANNPTVFDPSTQIDQISLATSNGGETLLLSAWNPQKRVSTKETDPDEPESSSGEQDKEDPSTNQFFQEILSSISQKTETPLSPKEISALKKTISQYPENVIRLYIPSCTRPDVGNPVAFLMQCLVNHEEREAKKKACKEKKRANKKPSKYNARFSSPNPQPELTPEEKLEEDNMRCADIITSVIQEAEERLETAEDELALRVTQELKEQIQALQGAVWTWEGLSQRILEIREELFTKHIQNSGHPTVERVYFEVERDYKDPYITKENYYEIFWYNVKCKSWEALRIPRVDKVGLVDRVQ